MSDRLISVHDALHEATLDLPAGNQVREGAMPTYTFRVHEYDVVQAEKICVANNTTLPAFLRKCCELLPRDYKP